MDVPFEKHRPRHGQRGPSERAWRGVAFIFNYKNEDVSRNGIGLFDFAREAWTQIHIPNFEKGVPIVVKAAATMPH